MSEETDTLIVYVRREVRDVVALTVPKGWKPNRLRLLHVLTYPNPLPPYQMPSWDPEVSTVWPDAWRSVEPGELVPKPWGQFDARKIIAKMPSEYDPEYLRDLQEEGAKAWADAPDAAQWARDLRGGKL